MLTVVCIFMRGPVAYTADYVVRLERMVRRHLDRPFSFVCLTDRSAELPESIESFRIPSMQENVPPNGVGYWAKINLFNPWLACLDGRVLYIDLDSLIVNDLSPIVDAPATFAITADALVEERQHIDTDRYGRKLVRKFNSSVMVWDAGTHSDIWQAWRPDVALRLSTDQDWIAERHPDAYALPYEWFPRISRVQPPWPDEAKVVLVKKPKNHEAVERWPWFEPLWGAA